MNAERLDPWVEGYLEYQRTVRRLAAGRDGVADREHRHKFACNFSSK